MPLRPFSAEARKALSVHPLAGQRRASLRTPSIARCCWRHGAEIGVDAHPLAGRSTASTTLRSAPGRAHAAQAAEQVTRALVGRTVADVERDLILETLKHCLGNRTHAANILGHLDPHAAQQAQRIHRRRRAGAAARRRRNPRRGLASKKRAGFNQPALFDYGRSPRARRAPAVSDNPCAFAHAAVKAARCIRLLPSLRTPSRSPPGGAIKSQEIEMSHPFDCFDHRCRGGARAGLSLTPSFAEMNRHERPGREDRAGRRRADVSVQEHRAECRQLQRITPRSSPP